MLISATEKGALNKHDVRRRLRNLYLTLLLFYSCQYSPVLRSLFSRAYCLTLSPLVFLDRKEKVELTNLLNTVTQTFHQLEVKEFSRYAGSTMLQNEI